VRPRRRARRGRPARAARADEPDAGARRRRLDRDVPLPRPREAAVRLGRGRGGGVTTTAPTKLDLQKAAREHLWLHFTRMGGYADRDVPIIVRGDGCYLEDVNGKRYL